ncbi:MAG TPA: hypothetical protein VJI67_01070 [archaeon]|nr:hypothetical protein [archaeon]HLD80516.1 hypothetical protein [archaeon]
MVELAVVWSALIVSLYNALAPSLIALPLAVLGRHYHRRLRQGKRPWSWIKSVFVVSFAFIYLLTVALVIGPFFFTTPESGDDNIIGTVNREPLPLALTVITSLVALVPRALVLTLLFTPLVFLGDAVFSFAARRLKWKGEYAWVIPLALSVYACTYVFIVLSYIFDWLLPALLYVAYGL